jgi:Zn-finger nucleic acid-binding protein
MTRISDRARYCHHCATPIVPQGEAGRATEHGCPACGPRDRLRSRDLGQPPVAVLECPKCAGIWLAGPTFELLAERARAAPAEDGGSTEVACQDVNNAPARSIYRRCPTCRKHMNRSNFGKRSGVVLDRCKEHGIWFDARELETVLRWIRRGGERVAVEREASETRHRERLGRLKVERPEQDPGGPWSGRGAGESGNALIASVIGALFDL